MPNGGVANGACHDLSAQCGHDVCIAGDGIEGCRVDQAQFGMLPPHQCFETSEFLGRKVHDGLVENPDLVAFDGFAQFADHCGLIVAIGPHAGVEHFNPVGATALGVVKCALGSLEKIVGAGLVAIVDGDTERARQHDFAPRHGDG